jgi:integrase
MTKKLTAITVENARAGPKRIEIRDGGCTGLYLVIQPSGAKSWALRYRYRGAPRKLTLGTSAELSLASARAKAMAALKMLGDGVDPAAEKKIERETGEAAQQKKAGDTVELAVAEFIEKYARRKTRTWSQTERIFRVDVLPVWRGRSVHEIGKRDILNLVEAIAADRPVLGNRAFGHIRKLFGWLVERDVLKISPCVGVKAPSKETSRERVLTEDEIKQVWVACDRLDQDFPCLGIPGAAVKLLLLTGQRRGEVCGMEWSEVDLEKRLWSLPGSRTKNGRPHVVPLSRQAAEMISAFGPPGRRRHVFQITEGFGSYSRIKDHLDARMPPGPAGWTFHDLRRTCATGLADLDVNVAVIEACLNHISGHKSGVAGIYNRSNYGPQKIAALQRWADRVDEIVASPAVNVQDKAAA